MNLLISFVIPLYNEEKSLRELTQKIKEAMSKANKTYEILYIDDGSTDSSLEVLKEIEKENTNVKVYSFRKNLGKSEALTLGFQKAKGEYVATLDADLQDDPESIQELLDELVEKKLDVINGHRIGRKDTPFKRYASAVFNNLISKMFDLTLHDMNCPVKVFKSETVKDLQLYGGLHRFIPLLIHDMGYKVGEREVVNHPRKYGISKFKGSKVITDLPDLFTIYFLTNYSARPLHFFAKIGFIPLIVGSVTLLYLLLQRLEGYQIGTRPLLTFGVLLTLFGVQIIFTGFLADLIVNTTKKETKKIPLKYES